MYLRNLSHKIVLTQTVGSHSFSANNSDFLKDRIESHAMRSTYHPWMPNEGSRLGRAVCESHAAGWVSRIQFEFDEGAKPESHHEHG